MNKKILTILAVICLVFISGCNKNNNSNKGPEELTEEEKIKQLLEDELGATTFRVYYNYQDGRDYTMTYVDLGNKLAYPTDPVRDGYKFKGWYLEKECLNKFNFSTDYIVESTMLYACWEEVEYIDYTYILDEYLPATITDSITLPTRLEDDKDIRLIWSSSDENTITNAGIVNPGREDINVTITLEVLKDGYSEYFTKEVTVKEVEFSPIREGKAVFGYYSYWNFAGYTSDSYIVDVINISFAYLNADFSIDMREISSYLNGMLEARRNDTRVVISLQGASGDRLQYFSNAAKTEESRKTLAANIVTMIEKYHFDGVDLDWEYPGTVDYKSSEATNYTLLVKEIYTQVKAANEDYLVTAAIPAGAEGHNRYELGEVSNYLDYIHLMSYDMEASAKVYHHTALYSNVGKGTATQASVADSVEIFTLKGVPASKLVVGIAFYGKYTTPSSSTNGGLGTNSATGNTYKTITYTLIYRNYLSRLDDGVTYYWDSICHAGYLYDSVNNIFITYDDEKSIKDKCQYVRDNGLGGVMIWELGEDTTGTLLNATLTSMKRK